ncbi:MAG: hypothetical protein L0221_01065 [Chloroflexi bacterium]|nr:hypothetical protein [Chloroflexota bacterium]
MLAFLAALALAVTACGTTTPSTPSASELATASSCDGHTDRGVLPTWARGGFSKPIMPHVVSVYGELAAIIWAPLSSPPSTDHTNKILWVLRRGDTGALTISAQRIEGTSPAGAPVERRLEQFPGPSTVDLPDPGCWRLTLTWADRTDSLDLEYIRPGSHTAVKAPSRLARDLGATG